MKSKVVWNEQMQFTGSTDNHTVTMDSKSPLGKDSGPTPKELVALGMGGCTAMDVIALLKKYKQMPESFEVEVDVTPSQGRHPAVFEHAILTYTVKGQVESEKLLEAVVLSMTKYCGVNAMLSKALPIHYRVVLNGQEVGSGQAQFSS